MEEEKEVQELKDKLICIINNIDRIDILNYLYIFIKGKTKAGE